MRLLTTIAFASFLTSALLISCNNHKQEEKQIVAQQKGNADIEVFEFPIKKFSLPYDTPVMCDSSSLIYLSQTPFDTSYLLHIRRQGSKVLGVCYVVPPSYHRDLEDFYDKEHELLFFDGFSFNLAAKQWEMLKKKTNEAMLNMPDTTAGVSPCFDCPSYTLFYDNKKRSTGSSKLRENFKAYDAFIRDSLIKDFLMKKQLQKR